MPQQIENKKITLYAIVEDTKKTRKEIKKATVALLNNPKAAAKGLRTLPLFPSFRGSLINADEKMDYEHLRWLRLVLKADLKDVEYPAFQFSKESDVVFHLLDAHEEVFEETAKNSATPPVYINENGEAYPITAVKYIDGENKKFYFYCKYPGTSQQMMTSVFSLNEKPELLTAVVNWFLNEDEAFRLHYNSLLKRAVQRKPSEIVDATNPEIVTVVNPASVSVVCTQASVWPKLTHATKINPSCLPRKHQYKYFLKQDLISPVAFSELQTAQGRSQAGWKYTISGGTRNDISIKIGKEKVKVNSHKSKVSLWRWLLGKSRSGRQK